ncbi:MAG: chemotaxis protein CheW [Candidatus Latescibacterota bacterium]|jgi:purine-binding chemotaxis protein CheW
MATIDWGEVNRRLKAAQDALERGWAPTPEEKGEILRARRKALAQEAEGVQTADHLEVVEFLLAYETYGIESVYVREVYPLRELTPVPCTPPFVAGIVNIRGQILSVVDLKRFFDLPEKGLTDLNKVIVVQGGGMELGILADAILGVRTVPLSDLQPSLPTLTGIRAEYLRGVTKERLAVLDAAAVLSDKRIIVREEVGS